VVDAGVDTGPIVAQARVEISPEDSETHLHNKIRAVEHKLLVQTVIDIANGRLNLGSAK
jgi:phosphoribosylglycinamide formyltransferase-1